MNPFMRTFISRKVTLSLILAQALLYFIGVIVPQKRILQPEEYYAWAEKWPMAVRAFETLGLTSVYSSPLVLAVTAVFFCHLVAVTWKRIPAVKAAMKIPEHAVVTPASLSGLPVREFRLEAAASAENLFQIIAAAGFRLVREEDSFRGIKHAFSPIGSLLFHVSFIVMLAGGATIFHTKFNGLAYVTEGQTFHGSQPEYHQYIRFSELRKTFPEIAFTLVSIRPEFEKNEAVSLRTELIPHSGPRNGEQVQLNANYPYADGSTTMLIKDVGIAPFFEVRDRAGKELLAAYINLNIMKGDEDHFAIPGTPYEVKVRFWSDFAVDPNGYVINRSFEIKRPLFKVAVLENGVEVASGNLHKPDEYLGFDGLKLSYRDINYFGTFLVTDEHGGAILITGFAIALIGLVVKLLFDRREVIGMIRREDEVQICTLACKCEYSRLAAERELERIVRRSGAA